MGIAFCNSCTERMLVFSVHACDTVKFEIRCVSSDDTSCQPLQSFSLDGTLTVQLRIHIKSLDSNY